jgi:hypothetical protein
MLRGRHRGLPVAIDRLVVIVSSKFRAILLPKEMTRIDRRSSQASSKPPEHIVPPNMQNGNGTGGHHDDQNPLGRDLY